MKSVITLTALAVFCLLVLCSAETGAGGSGSRELIEIRSTLRELGVADSLVRQWREPFTPLWALRWGAPDIFVDGNSARDTAVATDCPPSISFGASYIIATRFDPLRHLTEIYAYNGEFNRVVRYDIDSALNMTPDTLPLVAGAVWIVDDLDRDGNLDIVGQKGSKLGIYSAPDWSLRWEFDWPGLTAPMYPTIADVDPDPDLEIYVTPSIDGSPARVVLIDYDTITTEFMILADMVAPNGAYGHPAVGDFDEDGQMEFISGNMSTGYQLFEWQGTGFDYVGQVGDSAKDNSGYALACYPKPDGKLYALLGNVTHEEGYRYQLLEATGDNTFAVAHVFEKFTGAVGIHPCGAADTDCDGVDELVLHYYPFEEVWRWDTDLDTFVQSCTWDTDVYGSFHGWWPVDLDQNGTFEWGGVNHFSNIFFFPDPICIGCDSSGRCPSGMYCFCLCDGDPVCDSVTNVLDVVSVVDVAFRGASPPNDPMANCPRARTDVDCDDDTDVLDVVRFVNVAFKSADQATEFCDPCP